MATASISIVLRKRPKKDGTRPLILQITKDRKNSTLHTGVSIFENDWDQEERKVKKSHPNSVRLNNLLRKKLLEADTNSLQMETSDEAVTAEKVKAKIKPPAEILFFSQALMYLDDLRKSNKYNQYTSDKPRIRQFKKFMLDPKRKEVSAEEIKKQKQESKLLTEKERDEKFKKFLLNRDIPFIDITPGLLNRFVVHLKEAGDKGQRTIVNYLSVIRSVFSYADKNKIIDNNKISPFGKNGIKIKFPPTKKIGLSAEEVKRLEEIELTDARLDHIRNIWLFTYYFAGMRIADAFRIKWIDIIDGRLHYAMGKNDKEDSLKIPVKAALILDKYSSTKSSYDDFVFPELKDSPYLNNKFYLDRQIAFTTSRYDKFLKKYIAPAAGIEKTLTMHISRHTFGNISGDKIPPKMLQKFYRHSSIQTTMGYQENFIHKDIDEALDLVLGN